MTTTGCDKARVMLEQGWHEGLGDSDFRSVLQHVGECADCMAIVRSWSRVDAALGALAQVFDRATPPAGISARVWDALARERPATDTPASRPPEFELVRFLERLGSETAMREKIVRAGGPAARLEVLVTLAHEQGFRFSADTARQALMRRQAANDGELSEEQLEAVAGGGAAELELLHTLLGEAPPGGSPR